MSERYAALTKKEELVVITAQRNGGIVGVVPSLSPETHKIFEGLKAKGIFTISEQYTVTAGTTLYPSEYVVTEDTVGMVYKLVDQIEPLHLHPEEH